MEGAAIAAFRRYTLLCSSHNFNPDGLAYEIGGEETLAKIRRKKPILKNQVVPEIEAAVVGPANTARPDHTRNAG